MAPGKKGEEKIMGKAVNAGDTGGQGSMVTSSEIAKLIGKTTKTVQDLTNNGILPAVETKNGKRVSRKYDKYETIRAYIRYVEERALKKNGTDKEQEKLQVEVETKKTRLKMFQLQLEELEGRLHASEDVESMTDDLVLCVRSSLLAVPGQLAVDLAEMSDATEVSARLLETVCGILDDLSNYKYDRKAYEKRARERKGWEDGNGGEDRREKD